MEDGEYREAAALADNAIELVVKTFCPLPDYLIPPPGKSVDSGALYRFRVQEAERLFGIAPPKKRTMHNNRNLDRLRERRVGGPSEAITPTESRKMVRQGPEFFLLVMNSEHVRGIVSPALHARVMEQYELVGEPSSTTRLLIALESSILNGSHEAHVLSDLDYLEIRSKVLESFEGKCIRGKVCRLKVISDTNRGLRSEALANVPLAAAILRDIADWKQLIEVYKFESIAASGIKTPDARRRVIAKATEMTRGDPELLASLAAERAAIMRDAGEADAAAKYLETMVEQALARDNRVRVGRLQEQLARTYVDLGRFSAAEEFLAKSRRLIPHGYLMAHCLAALTAVELFARRGDRAEACEAAEDVRAIAEAHHYAPQMHSLAATLDRYKLS